MLGVLNQHLNTRTFLVGERVSLADITVVCSLLWLYKQVRAFKPILLLALLFGGGNGLDPLAVGLISSLQLLQVLDPSFRQPFANVTRWFVTCINQRQFKAVLGELKLCDKMAQFDGETARRRDRGW